jgi:hypothetical protein
MSGSAAVADLPDTALLAAARDQLGAAAGPDPAAYTGVHRDRASRDPSVNAAGRALGEMCRSHGLVVLNGRAPGDAEGAMTCPRGDSGGSLIDLCLISPRLYTIVEKLEVGGDYQRPPASSRSRRGTAASDTAPRYSDHRPVSLTLRLSVTVPPAARPPGGPKGKRARFQVPNWRLFAATFTADDAPALAELDAVATALASGSTSSTAAVDGFSKVMARESERAFRPRRPAGLQAEDAPWWDAACATAQAAFVQRAVERDQGLATDAAFRAARAARDRAKRQARARYDADTYRALVSACRADPAALWRELRRGERARCGLADCETARAHFSQQHGEAEPGLTGPGPADDILSFIAGAQQPGAAGPGGSVVRELDVWRACHTVLARRADLAEILNSPIQLKEVLDAINRLPNGKSPGCERAPAECYRYCRRLREGPEDDRPEINRMAPYLLILIEHIRTTGDFPEQFAKSMLTPVHKGKGLDPALGGSYRGIAVGGALGKCYASILLRRLMAAGKQQRLRHPAQAGFREGYSTVDHLFVLRHLIAKHRRPGAPPLIVVQIDFEKAFDKVSRAVLWKRLEERGVSGPMLAALQKVYEDVRLVVRVNGATAEPFASKVGVKQGCPLSTELFGLFIETLADYIDEADRAWGPGQTEIEGAPSLGSLLVKLLLYADDASLMATSPERMQFLLRMLEDFCAAFGMKVNVSKSEMMVFAATDAAAATVIEGCQGLKLSGAVIPMVAQARYLGLVYGPGKPFVGCREQLLASGRGAMCSLSAKLDRCKLWAPDLRVKSFNTQVRSVLSYGAEVWGPDVLMEAVRGSRRRDSRNVASGLFEACLRDAAVRLQITYFRHTSGAMRPTHRLLFAEMGALPLHEHWASLVVSFWNRTVKRPGSLVHEALVEEIRMGLETPNWGGWGAHVLAFLAFLGIDVWVGGPSAEATAQERAVWLAAQPLSVSAVMGNVREQLAAGWSHERLASQPREFVSDQKQPGVKMARYKHWMGLTAWGPLSPTLPAHSRAFIPVKEHQLLMRFRMGCWPLRVNIDTTLPRGERVCQRCRSGAVEDERHALLECPEYAAARAPLLCGPNDDMCAVMGRSDARQLAATLRSIWEQRFGNL